LRITTYSYYILPTLYNLTLVKYNRTLVEYGRTLCVIADGILSHIAAYYRILLIYCHSRQNLAEYSKIRQETRSSIVTRLIYNIAPINPATI